MQPQSAHTLSVTYLTLTITAHCLLLITAVTLIKTHARSAKKRDQEGEHMAARQIKAPKGAT
jgi:hypothetical protein